MEFLHFGFVYGIHFFEHHLGHTPFIAQSCLLPRISKFIIIPLSFVTSFHFSFLYGIFFLKHHMGHTPFITCSYLFPLILESITISVSLVASLHFNFVYDIFFLEHHLGHTPIGQSCSLPFISEFIIAFSSTCDILSFQFCLWQPYL